MRQPFGAIAVLFIAAAFLTGAAAGPNAADAQKIDACLKAAAEKRRVGRCLHRDRGRPLHRRGEQDRFLHQGFSGLRGA